MDRTLTLTHGQLKEIRRALAAQLHELRDVIADRRRAGDRGAEWDYALQLADTQEALLDVDRALAAPEPQR